MARRRELLDRAPNRPQVVSAQVRHRRQREAGLGVACCPEEHGDGGLPVVCEYSGDDIEESKPFDIDDYATAA
jgi:hypothetical protein